MFLEPTDDNIAGVRRALASVFDDPSIAQITAEDLLGDIARLAGNMVAKEEPFAWACYAETFFVPHSSMARWVKEADQVLMIDGCFLKCLGRVLNNFLDEEKIVHIDALSIYHKYTDLFDMEDVPEAERIETANHVAEQVLANLRNI